MVEEVKLLDIRLKNVTINCKIFNKSRLINMGSIKLFSNKLIEIDFLELRIKLI